MSLSALSRNDSHHPIANFSVLTSFLLTTICQFEPLGSIVKSHVFVVKDCRNCALGVISVSL